MSDFTIKKLEVLDESTPPGPWEWYWDQGIISLRGPGGEPIATDLTPEAADVLEASRALVDVLIAEKRAHQKLREDIEELRDLPPMITERMYDGYLSSSMRDYPAELTRILESDNG